jgi:AhpC/TSA family.
LPWFSVTDLDGDEWNTSLLEEGHPVLIVFLCQHSPYVQHIERNLGASMAEVIERGVTVLGISSNDARSYPADAPSLLRQQAERASFTFPYCIDSGQQAAKAFGASCTPEFFLYDKDWRCVYHGQYDGSRPGNEIHVTGQDVLAAIQATLADDDIVSRDQHPSLGCSIKWRAGNEPSYLFAFSAAF